MKGIATARFVAVSGIAFAAGFAWPWLVLIGPAWIAWALASLPGFVACGPPAIDGASISYARAGAPIVLEDPYVLAGIPLYLGLWAIAERPWRSIPWRNLLLGVVGLEAFAGLVLALVAICVDRGFTTSPAREPLELLALACVAVIRVLPLPLWMLLDPARATWFAFPARRDPGRRAGRARR